MSKEYLHRLFVLVGVIISGLGLSQLFVIQTAFINVLMICVGVIMIGLAPRVLWLRAGAFIFLFAFVFGIGRFIATVGRHIIYADPLQQSSEYRWQVVLYVVYGAIWVIWWVKTRRSNRKTSV